mgnify:CR=1 FL=1
MIDVNELRKGVTFEMDGSLYKVVDYSHNKTGRGNANIRIKARNLQTGANIERTFNSGLSVQDVRLDFHNVSYLYNDGDFYHFMDNETFEQPAVKAEVLGESAGFLKEGMECKLTIYNNEPLDVELPTSVDLKVMESKTVDSKVGEWDFDLALGEAISRVAALAGAVAADARADVEVDVAVGVDEDLRVGAREEVQALREGGLDGLEDLDGIEDPELAGMALGAHARLRVVIVEERELEPELRQPRPVAGEQAAIPAHHGPQRQGGGLHGSF